MPTIQDALGDLAVTYPAASRVFHEVRLDFCCNGRRSLADACTERGLDAKGLLARIAAAEAPAQASDWSTRPIEQLLEHIVAHYHDALRIEVPALIAMAAKVELVHADKQCCPRGLADHLRDFHRAMLTHLEKEEQILFPAIRSGFGASCLPPITCLEAEHVEHGAALAKTRSLAHDLVPPAEACTTWKALYLRLDRLEADLMAHIHLENFVLFPRVLVD